MVRTALCLVLLASTTVFASQPSLDDYAKLPFISSPKLSPDGTRYAAFVSYRGTKKLLVRSLSGDEEPALLDPKQFHVFWFAWANNDRLVVEIVNIKGVFGELTSLTRLGSIHRTGSNFELFPMRANDNDWYRQHAEIIHMLPDDPAHVLAALNNDPGRMGWANPEVDLVNVNTGKARKVLGNKLNVLDWIADHTGQIRIGYKLETKLNQFQEQIIYRKDNDSPWETFQSASYFDDERLQPVRFKHDDPNILLLADEHDAENEDVRTWKAMDLTTRQPVDDVPEKHHAIESALRRALPDWHSVNVISSNKADTRFIVAAESDTKPRQYFLFDLSSKRLDYFASARAALDDALHQPMQRVSYNARDGLEIPAFLTLPADSEKPPLIVLAHGGPWSHDDWGFNARVQYFASRGYAVLQPQFRGSTGYGEEHESAGYGEWGLKIQDDITDGVRWLIDEGKVDGTRVCIAGESYGGYAAAMGLVRDPDLYRCAVSVNGVLDLPLYQEQNRNLLFLNINKAVWNTGGDIKEASPYHQAERVTKPLLLIAGSRDSVVDPKHSRRMAKRIKRKNNGSDYIEIKDGEHWRVNSEHERIKLEAMDQFFAKHLGQPG